MWVWSWRRCWPTRDTTTTWCATCFLSPRCGGSPSVASAARYGWKPPTHGSLDGDPISSNEFLVLCGHSVRLTPAQSAALDRWLDFTMHFLATTEADYCLDALRGQLGDLRMGYAGQTCGRALELVADQVIPPRW